LFLKAYGPYRDRLERRAPAERAGTQTEERPAREPARTGTVVAVAAAYGLVLILAGVIRTGGTALLLNGLTGAALIGCDAAAWWMGSGS
jgi:hypothetical protein